MDIANWIYCPLSFQSEAECIFMTDNLDPSHELYSKIYDEQEKYGDVQFQNIREGFLFGLRFIYHLVYASINYDFQYILRSDDDYFLCFDRILYELPDPTVSMFHWGWVHKNPRIIRPDEAINIFSRDIIKKYLYQDIDSFYCHPMGGQLIGIWTAKLNITKLYRHDHRLHHAPLIQDAKYILTETSICNSYIGIHGAYPNYMLHFWKYRHNVHSSPQYKGDLVKNSDLIETGSSYHWEEFPPEWRYKPELCIKRMIWPSKQQGHPGENGDFYKGRQGK